MIDYIPYQALVAGFFIYTIVVNGALYFFYIPAARSLNLIIAVWAVATAFILLAHGFWS